MSRFSGPVRSVSNPNTNTTNNTSTAQNNGFICQSGSLGSVSSPPTDALIIEGTANSAAANKMTLTNAALGQASTITIPDPGAASDTITLNAAAQTLTNKTLTAPTVSGLAVLNSGNPTFVKVITAGQAALASGGSVTVQTAASGTAQYAVVDVKVMKSTGLSGNSGDRLLQLSDGTNSYNNAGITAALLGTPVTTVWGGSGNPLPSSSVDCSATTAGANLVVKYAGGTTDYNTGSVKLMITLAQVTA